MSAGQVEMSLREGNQVLVTFTALRVEGDIVASDMIVVCESPDVFSEAFIILHWSEKLNSP